MGPGETGQFGDQPFWWPTEVVMKNFERPLRDGDLPRWVVERALCRPCTGLQVRDWLLVGSVALHQHT